MSETLKALRGVAERDKLSNSVTPLALTRWERWIHRILSVQFPNLTWTQQFDQTRRHLVDNDRGSPLGIQGHRRGPRRMVRPGRVGKQHTNVGTGYRRSESTNRTVRGRGQTVRCNRMLRLHDEVGVCKSNQTGTHGVQKDGTVPDNLDPGNKEDSSVGYGRQTLPNHRGSVQKLLQLKEATLSNMLRSQSRQNKMFRPAPFTKYRPQSGKTPQHTHISWWEETSNDADHSDSQMMEIDKPDTSRYKPS